MQNSALVKLYGEILREIIGTRLCEERDRLGFNQSDLAKVGGASKRSQIDWEAGKSMPNAEYLALVATVGIDVLYVLTGKYSVSTLSSDESDLLNGFRSLDLRGKAGVMALIGGMNSTVQNNIKGDVGQIINGDLSTQSLSFTVGGKKKS
ncbi:helix-turn-helix domain-containing protein [Undibacterium danionis]|uniref:Helix-turn-helix domain-containing protein n=1 Tax=Undibacterium danionis TaxID=1812100 RepID=A0ABV6IJ32_9BURK